MAGGPTRFTDRTDALMRAATAGKPVAVWASREPEGLAALACKAGGALMRIEDGFIRSPGLGALFAPAYSLIFDRRGIYYDATQPNELEDMLAAEAFDAPTLARAAALSARLTALAVSKYAVGRGAAPSSPQGRTRVLVVGQVESDASIRLGGGDTVNDNLTLLEHARAQHPAAWIAYKPHPDVLHAGRPGAVPAAAAMQFADAIWTDTPIASALDWAEALHTISSLTGFEALLRGVAVFVHGRPFYAGWGLTTDLTAQPDRRGRSLDLDTLVAATLLRYPRYLDPMTGQRIEAEGLLDRLESGWTDPLAGRPLWHRAAAAAKRRLGPLRGRR